MSKNVLLGSMVVAGLVALAAITDIAIQIPFAGQMVMDIMFILGAAMVIYMGYESYKELT